MPETCPNPILLGEPHACEGRCACYVNHECVPDCTCNSCRHSVKQHVATLLSNKEISDKERAVIQEIAERRYRYA